MSRRRSDVDTRAAARRAHHEAVMAQPDVVAARERERAALAAYAAAHAEYRATRKAAAAAYMAASRKIKRGAL